MNFLLRISKGIDWFNEWVGVAMYWLCLAMSLIAAYNAMVRWIGGIFKWQLASNTAIELQWYLFGIMFLLGSAYVLKRNGHVRIDLLFGRYSPRTQSWVDVIGFFVAFLPFYAFMTYTTFHFAEKSWQTLEISPDPGGLPYYPIKTIIPIAFALLLIQGISELIKRIAHLLGNEDYAPGHFQSSREEL